MVPLPGVPGGPELIIILLIFAIVGTIVAAWIYRDATSRGSAWAWQWAVGIVMLFIIGFIPGIVGLLIYLGVRGEKSH